MLTRKLANTKTALLAGLLGSFISQVAAATDTVVAYGDDAARQALTLDAELQAQRSENARTIDRAIKANVEREITRIKAPDIRLALSEAATRG